MKIVTRPKQRDMDTNQPGMLLPGENDMMTWFSIATCWVVIMFLMWGLAYIPSGVVVYREYIAVITSFTCLMITLSVLSGEFLELPAGLGNTLLLMVIYLLFAWVRPELTTGEFYKPFGMIFIMGAMFYSIAKHAVIFMACISSGVKVSKD